MWYCSAKFQNPSHNALTKKTTFPLLAIKIWHEMAEMLSQMAQKHATEIMGNSVQSFALLIKVDKSEGYMP